MSFQHFNTKAVHFSSYDGGKNISKTKPIYQTSAFSFKSLEDMEQFFQGEKDYLYSRYNNPNTDDLGYGTAQLEGAPAGIATSSGMSAILTGVLAAAAPGDHIVVPLDLYGGTYQLFQQELQEWGIEVTVADFRDPSNIEAAIESNTTLLYAESVTNPLLRVENIEELITIARRHSLYVMIDNTFATPCFCQPYSLGADIVVHSATKYIGGHSDVTAGILTGHRDMIQKAKQRVINLGANLSPFEAWLACRGLKTLSVRMAKQAENAAALAEWFQQKSNALVYYPETLSEQGNGAMVTIDLGEHYDVSRFFQSLDWIKIVPTLAGVETTVSYPLNTSHRTVPDAIRNDLGITEGTVRISVGIEDARDIIDTFRHALHQAKK
ncbi:cystathionine gamma-synthase [Alteribacillus persepolensis]|uniref:homocysteine desulfhydrase n=1 Tax=Alteribacillus persepolensis TaxID=568899 RepID=A0A1G8J5J4_9BACI|nr:PLP-dependent aspartate aminotransferase family protein [Alteribacillus persepolensis]SDI26548.1 cystathionine gamma-synthase [Alteribacillus persepolensis]